MEEISRGTGERDRKMRNYRHERKECSTMRDVQREETRRRARDTISMLFARRRRVRARTPPPSEHTLTHFPEIILSRKKIFYTEKNLNVPRHSAEKSKSM